MSEHPFSYSYGRFTDEKKQRKSLSCFFSWGKIIRFVPLGKREIPHSSYQIRRKSEEEEKSTEKRLNVYRFSPDFGFGRERAYTRGKEGCCTLVDNSGERESLQETLRSQFNTPLLHPDHTPCVNSCRKAPYFLWPQDSKFGESTSDCSWNTCLLAG